MSNAIIDAAIAASYAGLTQQTPFPTPPLFWGSDVSCDQDLDPTKIVDSLSPEAITQGMHRRLVTPRGKLVDDPAYGWDLCGELNTGLTTKDVDGIARRVRSEVTKDDRIQTARVRVVTTGVAQTIRVEITVYPVNPRTGTFRAIMIATPASLVLQEISRP